jgi:hypothetical protein
MFAERNLTDCFAPIFERSVRSDDPNPVIPWPLDGVASLSANEALDSSVRESSPDISPAP